MARIYYATDDGRLHPLAHSVHACSVECLARIVVERTGADRLCAIEGVDVMPAEGNVGRVADDREGDYA